MTNGDLDFDIWFDALANEHERYVSKAEGAVKQALGMRHDDHVTIGSHGEVFRHGGRTERVQ